jgi:hypothetical protein
VTAAAGGSTVALSGGSLASGSCAVTVKVRAASAGAYTTSLAVGSVTSANAGTNTAAAQATLTVASCSTGGVNYSYAAPANNSYSPSVEPVSAGTVISFATTGPADVMTFNDSPYYYNQPDSYEWSISACQGDFSVPAGGCHQTGVGPGTEIFVYNPPSGGCVMPAGTTYYINLRVESCSYGTCGFRLFRR